VLLYTVVVFGFGALAAALVLDRLHGSGLSLGEAFAALQRSVTAVPRQVHARLTRPDVEKLVFDVKFKHYSKLASKRADALARFHLEATDDDWVPATIQHGEDSLRARIRLKGDWIDHLEHPKKWSFRINLRGESTMFGMKRFSIQHPRTRNYIYEWIYHEALRREDLVALRYDFVDVTLNGDSLGLYALEEHFDRRLVEHARRPAGPIVRFDEGLMFRLQLQHRPFRAMSPRGSAANTAISNTLEPYLAAEIDAFQSGQALEDPALLEQHVRAMHLLEAFRRGESSTSETFDVDSMARFFALSDLLGARHSAQWRNMRFYYNPITSLLEPIAFDGDAGAAIRHLSCVVDTVAEDHAPLGERRWPFVRPVFDDPAFFEAYVRELDRVSRSGYLERLWGELDEPLQDRVKLLRSEFPGMRFSKRVLERNRQYLRAALEPVQALHAYLRTSRDDGIELELGNIQALPIEILGVTQAGTEVAAPPTDALLRPASMDPPIPVEYRTVRLETPGLDLAAGPLVVRYRIPGTDEIRERQVTPWPHASDVLPHGDLARGEANARSFDFLRVDDATREIVVEPGDWKIDRDLIVPAGYRLIARAGTRLNLSNGASVLSRSPLDFVGTADHPIVIRSADGGAHGLVVLHAGARSNLEHVAFDNLANPSRAGWEPTGAVTFYESPVQILDSSFAANRSEDALHIVRTRFEIGRSVFRNTAFDAFDADFSEGILRDVRFVDAGNDAVDVSGSVVELEEIVVEGCGDKALSAGERSRVQASNLSIRRAEIGLASKDSSTVSVAGLDIRDGAIGLTAFQKKSEFGPASIDVRGLTLEAVDTPYLVERDSSVSVDGRSIPATEQNLRARLYAKPD
jgi:hypothetical protein